MDIFGKISKKFGLSKEQKEKSKTEELMEQRDGIKLDLAVKLYKKGCSDEQIEEVLAIIQNAEDDIARIKQTLIGTNINPIGDPMRPVLDAKDAIRKRQLEMQQELNEAIKRILGGT